MHFWNFCPPSAASIVLSYHCNCLGQSNHSNGLGQSNHCNFLSQPHYRHSSRKSHHRHFSSQSAERDYVEQEKQLDRKSRAKRSRSWAITLDVTINLREHLTNNPKYSGTIYKPTLKSESIFGEDSESNNINKQIVKEIYRLFEKGERKEAMDVFVDTVTRCTKYQQDILKPLEKCLASHIDTLSLSNSLYAFDVFSHVEYRPRYLLGTLLRHLAVHFESVEKTPPNIVHLLYLIGLSRDAPVELMQSLEIYIENNISEFNAVEIGIISFGFFVANRAMESPNLTQAMAETILSEFKTSLAKQSHHEMNLYLLGNIFKAFRHAGFKNVKFYEELGDIICESDWGLNDDQRIHDSNSLREIVRTYAILAIKHERLYKKMQDKFPALQSNQSAETEGKMAFGLKDLGQLCWSYHQLQIQVPQHWQEALVDQLNATPLSER